MPNEWCGKLPQMPSTTLKVRAQADYYYICNALIYCEDSPHHRSSIKIGNDSISLLDSYRDPSRFNSARYIKLTDESDPIQPNPSIFSFDFFGLPLGLEEQIMYELISEVSGFSPFGVGELRTRTTINLSLTTNDRGYITYRVPEPVPAPLGILGLGVAATYSRSLKKRLAKERK